MLRVKLLKACVSIRSASMISVNIIGTKKNGFFYEIAHYLVALTKTAEGIH